MVKLIDIDSLFDKYIEDFVYSNIGKVKPEEIENKIPEVKEVMVYGEDDSIVAEIFADAEIENVESIIDRKVNEVNQKLPLYKRISRVRFTDTEFPKTTTKKIKRTHITK